jgi:HlyD family secretion protein
MIESSSPMDRPAAPPGRFSRTTTIATIATVVLLIAAAIVFPAARRWSAAERSVDASILRVGTVTRGDLQRDVSVQARVVASLHPALFSPAQGIINLKTKAGMEVKRGDVLATIESAELRSALSQAESQLASMQADLERQRIVTRQSGFRARQQVDLLRLRAAAAKRSLERYSTMFSQGIGNKAELEAAQDNVRIAELEYEQSRKELDLGSETLGFEVQNREQQVRRQDSAAAELRRKVEELTVRAPFDGMIATIGVQDRDAVAPNQALLTIVNLSSFELELPLPEEYSSETSIGTPAKISVSGREYDGHVTAISPEVVNSQVNATVAFTGVTPPGIKQSQRVTARLVFESKRNVLKVPRGAFFESGGGRSAYVVDGKLATRRDVTFGASSVSEVEVVRGLDQGEEIVVSDTTPFSGAKSVLLR